MGKDGKYIYDKLVELIKETTPIKDEVLISKFGQILNVLGRDDIPTVQLLTFVEANKKSFIQKALLRDLGLF